MIKKRHKPEEIVPKVEVLTAQGQSIAEAVSDGLAKPSSHSTFSRVRPALASRRFLATSSSARAPNAWAQATAFVARAIFFTADGSRPPARTALAASRASRASFRPTPG